MNSFCLCQEEKLEKPNRIVPEDKLLPVKTHEEQILQVRRFYAFYAYGLGFSQCIDLRIIIIIIIMSLFLEAFGLGSGRSMCGEASIIGGGVRGLGGGMDPPPSSILRLRHDCACNPGKGSRRVGNV